MKKLLLILTLFLPSLLFAQQDSTKQVFKIKKEACRVAMVIDTISYFDTATVKLAEFSKTPYLKMNGCGDSAIVISFRLRLGPIDNILRYMDVTGAKFSNETIEAVKRTFASYGMGRFSLFIENIKYQIKDNGVQTINKMVIHIIN